MDFSHVNGRTTKDNNNTSVMSINQLCNTDTDYPDEIKEAAAVLETMKQKPVVTSSIESTESTESTTTDSSSPPSPLEPSQISSTQPTDGSFMSRINNIGLVRKTMNAYEQGKANSPFIKYTTEMVESSVSLISKPVIDKIPQLAQLDQYACKGESRKRRARGDGSDHPRSSSPSYRSQRNHRSSQSNGTQNSNSFSHQNNNNQITSQSSSISTTSNTTTITRSRWQQMLVGAAASASAAGAAVSEESMKSLKYCLQWLRVPLIPSSAASATLSSIKKEVVDTLRRVIEVVSKYASVCLPDQAKKNVRFFILELPTRWAYMNHNDHSASPSPMSSPQLAPANSHPINQTTDYAHRLLSLASESRDMLNSVAGIFSETVVKAESWVGKLRYVGMTGGGANAMGQIHFDVYVPVDHLILQDSSESEVENMRMEMDQRQSRAFKAQSHSKRKKVSAKNDDDRMVEI
ncbi:6345_t:CDS:2 [Entrophospora sp. SA101]|nr:6345_t:CDS:2 [Entrophospora sp. SA101]